MAKQNKKYLIYDFIAKEYARNRYSPPLSEIAGHFGLTAKSNIHRQIQQLVEEGLLKNMGGRYVPVKFLKDTDVTVVPILGSVAAGQPIEAVEDITGYVAYSPRFGDGDDFFALRIKGESMIEIGIMDGDVVIIKKTPQVEDGDVAVVMIDGEATVKTFYRENGYFRLQPENRSMKPIIVREVSVLGKVLATIRYIQKRGPVKPLDPSPVIY